MYFVMGGIPESMQLVKTQRLLLFGPFYNDIKKQVPQAQRETQWKTTDIHTVPKKFTGKSTQVKKNYLKPVRC
jgi:hypothetical protein